MGTGFTDQHRGLLGSTEYERVTGNDPAYLVWKTSALPLSYTRITHVRHLRSASGRSPKLSLLRVSNRITPTGIDRIEQTPPCVLWHPTWPGTSREGDWWAR
jgi:hypothetical protein